MIIINPTKQDDILVQKIIKKEHITYNTKEIINLANKISVNISLGTLNNAITYLNRINSAINCNKKDADLKKENNLYFYVIQQIIKKQLVIANNIKLLLDQKESYGAYALWRNLYEMSVIFFALTYPMVYGKSNARTNILMKRYCDYSKIEKANLNNIGFNLSKRQQVYLTSQEKEIYKQANLIYHQYNDLPDQQGSISYNKREHHYSDSKLIANYDWSIPLFNKTELANFRPEWTPNLYALVKLTKCETFFYENLYSEYNQASGYIHSSFLSTQYVNDEKTRKHINTIATQVLNNFTLQILRLPWHVMDNALADIKQEKTMSMQKQEFIWQTYYYCIRKLIC